MFVFIFTLHEELSAHNPLSHEERLRERPLVAEGPAAEEVDFYLAEATTGGANNLSGTGFVQNHLQGTKFSPSPGEKGTLRPELKHADIPVLAILVSFKNMCVPIPVYKQTWKVKPVI